MHPRTADRSPAPPHGSPPLLDPELAPVIEMLTSVRPPDAYRPDTIIEMRRPVPGVEKPTDEALSRGGAYTVEQRVVPEPAGDPDISLMICRPRHATSPTPRSTTSTTAG